MRRALENPQDYTTNPALLQTERRAADRTASNDDVHAISSRAERASREVVNVLAIADVES